MSGETVPLCEQRGIRVYSHAEDELQALARSIVHRLRGLVDARSLIMKSQRQAGRHSIQMRLAPDTAEWCAPSGDTARIPEVLGLNSTQSVADLGREILLAMLVSPISYEFPSCAEFRSKIRIRRSIVQAARRTKLAFATYEAERPADYWRYEEDRGFLLRPGKSLIVGLERATVAGDSERFYTFSCRRATEYILLLGVAKEALRCNRTLLERMHQQAETRALKGSEFEQAFVRTLGSPESPMPLRFFVPGDRTWFRNPDPISSNATGYEGSWTFYLGSGLFADFWRPGRAFTLETKAVSLYHWRNATYRDSDGELQVDEARAHQLVETTLRNPSETKRIVEEMVSLQKPLGTDGGGAIEAHRERACCVHPETTDVVLPDVELLAERN